MEHKVEYLNQSSSRSTGPILSISRKLFSKATSPCEENVFEKQTWYIGSGISPESHPGRNIIRPLENAMLTSKCLYCESQNILVIALQGCVNMNSGDAYFDYELICKDCNKFSAVSYAEN